MKSTGMVRRIDPLGRLVLPKELRDNLGINEAPIEILVDGENIVLRKYSPNCIFCGSIENIVQYKDKLICKQCLDELKNQ